MNLQASYGASTSRQRFYEFPEVFASASLVEPPKNRRVHFKIWGPPRSKPAVVSEAL